MSVNIREVWNDLGGGPLVKSGAEYRARAFWREGDNPNSIAIDTEHNRFFDFVEARGGGPWELAAMARKTSVEEGGRWIRERYGESMPVERTYSDIRHSELKEAPAWLVGFLEYADLRLVELKEKLAENPDNPDTGERVLRLTQYEARMKNLHQQQGETGIYPQRALYQIVEEYRIHNATDPAWSQEVLRNGQDSIAQARSITGYAVNRMAKAAVQQEMAP